MSLGTQNIITNHSVFSYKYLISLKAGPWNYQKKPMENLTSGFEHGPLYWNYKR